ncbi:hypothetical protein OB03_07005 [Brevundimonas sp. GN22]
MFRLTELFFHSTHRIGRVRFAFGATVLALVSGAVVWADANGLAGWAAFLAKLLIAYSAMCVMSLRLHDLGRSGWWSWLVVAAIGLAEHLDGWPCAAAGAGVAVVLILLAVLPGQPHLNRHGPPV